MDTITGENITGGIMLLCVLLVFATYMILARRKSPPPRQRSILNTIQDDAYIRQIESQIVHYDVAQASFPVLNTIALALFVVGVILFFGAVFAGLFFYEIGTFSAPICLLIGMAGIPPGLVLVAAAESIRLLIAIETNTSQSANHLAAIRSILETRS